MTIRIVIFHSIAAYTDIFQCTTLNAFLCAGIDHRMGTLSKPCFKVSSGEVA
jgi:hypothetical protein